MTAFERLDRICIHAARVLHDRERDLRWQESSELEAAALAYGRFRLGLPEPVPDDERQCCIEFATNTTTTNDNDAGQGAVVTASEESTNV